MEFRWDEEKNQKLMEKRGISFEEIVEAFNSGGFIKYGKQKKAEYSHQKVMYVLVDDYVCAVPYIEKEDYVYLITAFKSRKIMKMYLKGEL